MVCAPLLLLASTVAYSVTDGLGVGGSGGLLQVLSMATFSMVVLGLVTRIADSAPRTAATLLLLGCLGCAGGVGYGVNAIVTGIDGLDLNDADGAAVILKVIGPIFPVAFLGLGLALDRFRLVPRPAAASIMVAAVLFPISRIGGITPLALLADTLFLMGLTGVALASRRDEVAPTAGQTSELNLHA